MWNVEPSDKVMNIEVVSHNDILKSKRMIDLRLIGLNDIMLILRKVMMSFLSPLWGRPSGPFFGRVNMIGYELHMEPFYMNIKCELLYENEGYKQVSMLREVVLVKEWD